MIAFSPDDSEVVFDILAPVLRMISIAAPTGLEVSRAKDKIDFVIEISSFEQARRSREGALSAMESTAVDSQTYFDRQQRRWVVRLLWDRLAFMKNSKNEFVPHPNAFGKVLSAMAREVLGTMPIRLSRRERKFDALTAAEIRETHLASAAAVGRLLEREDIARDTILLRQLHLAKENEEKAADRARGFSPRASLGLVISLESRQCGNLFFSH